MGGGIPCIVMGEAEEDEAARLAGLEPANGYPGREAVIAYLDARFPSKPAGQ